MLEVDGKYVDKLEVKGLDMKRRVLFFVEGGIIEAAQ
jgi:hypothetical protein